MFINKRKKAAEEIRKRSHIETFFPHIVIALKDILKLSDAEAKRTTGNLKTILES